MERGFPRIQMKIYHQLKQEFVVSKRNQIIKMKL